MMAIMNATLIATTDVGCSDTMSTSINVLAQTDISAGLDRVICMGERTLLQPLILGDTSGATYFWSPATALDCTNCLEAIANPNDTITYTFTYINADGCQTQSSVNDQCSAFSRTCGNDQ